MRPKAIVPKFGLWIFVALTFGAQLAMADAFTASSNYKRVVHTHFKSRLGIEVPVDFGLTYYNDIFYHPRYPAEYQKSKWLPWAPTLNQIKMFKSWGKDGARDWSREYGFTDIFKLMGRAFAIAKEIEDTKDEHDRFLVELALTDAPVDSPVSSFGSILNGLTAASGGAAYFFLDPSAYSFHLVASACLIGAGAEFVRYGVQGLLGVPCELKRDPRAMEFRQEGFRYRVLSVTKNFGQITDVMLETDPVTSRSIRLSRLLSSHSCAQDLLPAPVVNSGPGAH